MIHALGATEFVRRDFAYDAAANVTGITDLAQTRAFAYDDLERLTAAGTALAPESYAFDPEGNRTTSHLSASHITDAANRLTEDDAFTYAYDANGNLISKTAKASGAVTDYGWDAQNQLTRIDFPDLTFAEYRYDPFGRRIEKNVGGTVTRYVYDGQDMVLEFDGTGTLRARYSHGQFVDQPLAMQRDGQSYFFHADRQGSILRVTDAAGAVVNEYEYDSYGNFETRIEGVANPFTYTGREFDAESGLYYYRARYYDPATGRFLSEDPLNFAAGDSNLYRYVFSNPVNLTDPSGLAVTYEYANNLSGSARLAPSLAGFGASLSQAFRILAQAFILASIPATPTDDDDPDSPAPPNGDPDGNPGEGAENPPPLPPDLPPLPPQIKKALDEILSGKDRPNRKDPESYRNKPTKGEQKLPETDANGNPIDYTRHHVNEKLPKQPSDDQRIVTGSDGSIWYTLDKYFNFTRIR